MLAYLKKCIVWIQQFFPVIKRNYQWIAIALIIHMFYKVPLDSLTGGLFNLFLMAAICLFFFLYFSKEYHNKRNGYVLISFACYALCIVCFALFDGELRYVKRGVYEYGFYQMIIFAAAFLVPKISKEDLVKYVVIIGFPFVAAGVFGALTYSANPSSPMYSGDTAMRIVGFARSPLSMGMLSGIYCLFALSQVKMSSQKKYWIPFATGIVSLLVSGSRGPLVAFCAGLAGYLVIGFVAKRGKAAVKPLGIAAGVLLFAVVLFFTTNLEFSDPNIQTMYLRLKRIVDWNGDAGNVGRLETWRNWFKVFLDNPWLGIGMSRTGSWSSETLGVTESGFLRHLVELGIVGSTLYYNLIASCIVCTVKALKPKKNKLNDFTLLNIAVIVLVLVEDMVLQITEEITVAFFLWWCLGSLLGDAENREREARMDDKVRGGSKMSVSVVVTTYNGAKWVVEQLESLLWQTRQPDEVLIFDDCSSDNTVEIVSDFIREHQLANWSLMVNEKNKGWKENFKHGLLLAKGDLVFPCDQDDIWRKDKLAICERIMDENPNILVLASNYEQFGDCQQKIVPNGNDKEIVQIKFHGNLFKVFYPGCSYCIRNSFLQDIEKNWTPSSPHDATIWRYAIIRNGLFALNDDLLLWRVYNTSTYEQELKHNHNRRKKREWLDYAMGVLRDVEDYLADHPDYRTEQVTKALDKNKEFMATRMEFYDNRNVLTGLNLLGYIKFYAAPIQYAGDWLHTFRK